MKLRDSFAIGLAIVLATSITAVSASAVSSTRATFTTNRAGQLTLSLKPPCAATTTAVSTHALAIHSGIATGSVTIVANCWGVTVSLVSYKAPAATYSDQTASQQTVFDSKTVEFATGPHQLEVNVPNCYFQVDLVVGLVIQHLGPANSTNFYGPQHRLLDAINGGTKSCSAGLRSQSQPSNPPPSPTDTPAPSPTDTPAPTPTDTPAPPPTDTAAPSHAPTDAPAATPTPTPTPTATPAATPTATPAATPTDTPAPTPTATPAATPTDTPAPTRTDSPAPAPTGTPSEGADPV